jgi:trans-aconitate 2-methyltransferase
MSKPPRDWNADSYQRVSAPLEQMGRDVLDRLVLDGGERVLDAGCGTGRVTAALLERLPRGEVVAVDGSPAMVEKTRELLGDDPRLSTAAVDLLELELDRPVDAILSTATFHWIGDHDRLFDRLFAALRPGGRLVAQCGGEGNITAVRAAIARVAHPALADWSGPWHFASTRETHARLESLGYRDVWCWPQSVRVTPEDLGEYLATVVLGSHLERLDAADHGPFVDAVRTELGDDGIDYVRLNLLARRPS